MKKTGKIRDYQKIPTHRRGRRFADAAKLDRDTFGTELDQVQALALEDAAVEGAAEEHPRESGVIKRRPGGLRWKAALPLGILGFGAAYFFGRPRIPRVSPRRKPVIGREP